MRVEFSATQSLHQRGRVAWVELIGREPLPFWALISVSNCVGCPTGRSDGFAPFQYFVHDSSVRRNMALWFAPYAKMAPASSVSREYTTSGRRRSQAKSTTPSSLSSQS